MTYDSDIDYLLQKLYNLNGLFIPSYNEESNKIPLMNEKWLSTMYDLYTKVVELNKVSPFPIWFSGTSAANFFGVGNL